MLWGEKNGSNRNCKENFKYYLSASLKDKENWKKMRETILCPWKVTTKVATVAKYHCWKIFKDLQNKQKGWKPPSCKPDRTYVALFLPPSPQIWGFVAASPTATSVTSPLPLLPSRCHVQCRKKQPVRLALREQHHFFLREEERRKLKKDMGRRGTMLSLSCAQ